MQDHGFGLRRIQLSTKFVNKAKGRAGAMRWMLRATLKSKVLLYALALTYLLRELLQFRKKHQLCPTPR